MRKFGHVRSGVIALWGCALASGIAAGQDGSAAGVPTNDECRSSLPISDGDTAFDTVGATTDGLEHFPICNVRAYASIYHDIWYRYIATCDGQVSVSLCNSNFDTRVAVYSGCSGSCPPSETPLACDDDSCLNEVGARVTVPAVQSACYMIRVGGYNGQEGTGTINITCSAVIPTGACCNRLSGCRGTLPQADCNGADDVWYQGQDCSNFVCPIPNDQCINARELVTGAAPVDGTTVGADGSISTCSDNDTKDVWFKWMATCTGEARITTCGSSFDTTLAVYDSCGADLMDWVECEDDGCPVSGQTTRSMVKLHAFEGTTYYIRLAGRLNTMGIYNIRVEPCRNACCINNGFNCQNLPEQQCTGAGGDLAGPGAICLSDANQNGIDDACETDCPAAIIAQATPPSGMIDSRQPHAQGSPGTRQGIGAPGAPGVPAEPIDITLSPAVSGAEGCFELCETVVPQGLSPNDIASVVYQGSGVYRLTLLRPISANAVTKIRYLGGSSTVQYTFHPANVDGTAIANPADIIKLVDNINGQVQPPLPIWRCDLNRSAVCNAADIITLVDLLNGNGFAVWNGTSLPSPAGCP